MSETAAPAPTTTDPAPAPSFADALLGKTPAPEPPAPTPAASAPDAGPAPTPGTPTPPPPTPAADEWVAALPGGYKSAEEVRAALGSLDQLKANQLSDDQRTVLALADDPEKWREYQDLVHRDLAQVGDEELLLDAFRAERPGMAESEVLRLFHRAQDQKYPGIGAGEEDADHKADLAERKREADQLRQKRGTERETRLAELKKGALAYSPAAQKAAQEQAVAQHLDFVKQTVAAHPDGLKLTVDVDGQPLNLVVEAKDMPALQAVMNNPLAALYNEAGTGLDPQKLLEFAAWQTNRPAFLTAARKAGQSSNGPQVSLDELHNAEGGRVPTPAGDGSLAAAILAGMPAAAPKPRW